MPTATSDWEPVTNTTASDWEPVPQSDWQPVGLSDAQLAAVLPKKPIPSVVPESTIAGGPQLRQAGTPQAGKQLAGQVARGFQEAQEPFVPIPKPTVQPNDSKTAAVGKEAARILIGIPEFVESPMGIATMGFGQVLPKTVATLFTADAVKNLGEQTLKTHKDWDKYTPAQKAAAVTDIVGSGTLATVLGGSVAKALKTAPETAEAATTPEASPKPATEPPAPPAKPLGSVGDAFDKLSPVQQAKIAEVVKPAEQAPKVPIVQPSTAPAKAPQAAAASLPKQITPLKPEDLRPALLIDGKPVIGETHQKVLDTAIKSGDPDLLDKALTAFQDDTKHVFVDKTGKVYSRIEAAKALGQTEPLHSEVLNDLKAAKPSEEMVTLYRAESPTVKFNDVFDADKLKDFKYDKEGQSWTDDPKFADYMRESYGKDAVIKKITIPKPETEKYRVSGFEYKIPKPAAIAPVEPPKPSELPQERVSAGPGAAAKGEPGTYSPIQEMSDRLRTTATDDKPIDDQISAIDKAKATLSDVKDRVKKGLANVQAIGDAMVKKYRGLPEYGDEQRAVGKWFYALQRSDHEARQFAKTITDEVPSKLRREAITNWIQAEGNPHVLQERAEASSGTIRQGYEIAQRLKPREQEIAGMIKDYYDKQLANGIDSGILKSGLENYVTQVWKKENPITKRLVSELSSSKLQPNFKYARKRIFDSYFEGEQAGYVPQKDAGFLVANYDQAFNRSLAARAFIKDLHEGKASDGRPLVELSGNGKLIGDDEGPQSILINPHAKPEDISDYRTIDHPALRGWKWATKTPEGKNVFVKGDMLVHPEAYAKLKNRLSVSAFRQNPVTRTFLRAQSDIKQTMLSISGFHQVQETLHALAHRVNPANLPTIDFSDPVTKALSEHGLQLADYNALADFSEGLQGGLFTAKIPLVGPKLKAYNEFLFQDYIPRLKLQMAKLTLKRNQERYRDLSPDKLLELSARQANSAFGELPYKYWGRSPTLQDALKTFLLAPDFLEARSRFVGGALKPFGKEQLVAIGLLAATQYITARIVNQIIDGDAHLEPENAFRIIAKGHAYGLRTIPGDLLHLFSDTRGFFYNRMSPALRTAVEYVTGRDDRGVRRDILDQVKDLAKMPIPLAAKSRLGQKWWESFLNSFGVQEQRWDAVQTIGQKAAAWKKANGVISPVEITYDPDKDKYAPLKMAIENDDQKAAQREFGKLKSTEPAGKIYQHFKLSLEHPITGSRANDQKFFNSLDNAGKQEYKEAKDLRDARLRMVQSLK